MRFFLLLAGLLCLSCGSGGTPVEVPDYAKAEVQDLGWIIIRNGGDECYECLEILMDGEMRVSHCAGPALCPGAQADGLYESHHTYEITLWSASGAIWAFPPFVLDDEQVLEIP